MQLCGVLCEMKAYNLITYVCEMVQFSQVLLCVIHGSGRNVGEMRYCMSHVSLSSVIMTMLQYYTLSCIMP